MLLFPELQSAYSYCRNPAQLMMQQTNFAAPIIDAVSPNAIARKLHGFLIQPSQMQRVELGATNSCGETVTSVKIGEYSPILLFRSDPLIDRLKSQVFPAAQIRTKCRYTRAFRPLTMNSRLKSAKFKMATVSNTAGR